MTSSRPTQVRRALLAAAAVTMSATTTLPLAAPAQAQGPKLVVIGLGATETTTSGATFSADLSGSPLSGHSTGRMTPADGSLPALGECEPATATLRVDDADGKRFYELSSAGEVCALYLPLGVMQHFSGRFTVASTNVRKIARTTGVVDFRLMNGQADLYATS